MLHLKKHITSILTIVFLMTCTSLTIAQASGKLARANAAYDKMAYTPAIELYKSVLDELEDYEAMGKLADCFRLTNQYQEAEYWYGKVTGNSAAKPEHLLYYAQVLQINEKYEEAAKWYIKYKALVPSDARASYQIDACENYQDFFKDVDRYKIEHPNFNSPVYDFSPVYFEDGIVFSSSRDSVKSLKQTHTWTGLPFFDLYFVEEDKKDSTKAAQEGGAWTKPSTLKGRVNTKYHEGPLVFTADNSKVYFTRNNFDNTRVVGKTGKSTDKIVKLKLYTAEVENGTWTNIQEFLYSNDEYSVGHAAISPDGNHLYFVSDMPGGYGGTDLYVCNNKNGAWGTPLNLGPSINTEGDEMFPYVNADSTFYFSSDGHGGIGGLDIFKVSGSGTNWGKVKNFGAPINSSADDFGIVFNEEKTQGYFTSDRTGGSGSDDIYKFIDEGITLEGIIVDAKTDEPICAATSELVYLGEIIGDMIGECDGMFEYSVLPGRDYSIEGCAEGYECNTVQTTTKGVKPGGKVFVKIPLIKPDPLNMEVLVIDKITKQPIPGAKVVAFKKCDKSYDERIADAQGMSYYKDATVNCEYNVSANAESYMPADKDVVVDGSQNPVRVVIELEKIGSSPLVLKHIYYDFDQSYIREEAELDLNKVFNFMTINPGTIVEIGSHTDARASFKYNERLSERRAKAAVQWLIQRGISKDRLVAVGYGEYQVINQCKDNVPCEEVDHQMNRRTEFRVLDNVSGIDVKSIERNDMLVDPCLKCPF
jgi:outer membrane protein OmpA-like peptidoglycan-associated protein